MVVSRAWSLPGALSYVGGSHHRADLPGHEFVVAIAEGFRLRLLAGRNRNHLGENLSALLVDRDAIQNIAAVDVHVFFLALPGVVVGGKLDRRRRLEAERRTASRREGDHIAAGCDLAGDAD